MECFEILDKFTVCGNRSDRIIASNGTLFFAATYRDYKYHVLARCGLEYQTPDLDDAATEAKYMYKTLKSLLKREKDLCL